MISLGGQKRIFTHRNLKVYHTTQTAMNHKRFKYHQILGLFNFGDAGNMREIGLKFSSLLCRPPKIFNCKCAHGIQ